jgi:Type VI secretion system/phage-baseplate injector OB domain
LSYLGSYLAVVVNNVDPMAQNRLEVTVPGVTGDSPVWAARCTASPFDPVPAIGDQVDVVFEEGDPRWPLWQSTAVAQGALASGGHGVRRATVVDPLDPQQANRLQVTVPSVTYSESLWATASPAVGANLPNLGDQVWVQFAGGDVHYAVWIGVM